MQPNARIRKKELRKEMKRDIKKRRKANMERVGFKITLPVEAVVNTTRELDGTVQLLVRRYETGEVEVDIRADDHTVWTPVLVAYAGADAEQVEI